MGTARRAKSIVVRTCFSGIVRDKSFDREYPTSSDQVPKMGNTIESRGGGTLEGRSGMGPRRKI